MKKAFWIIAAALMVVTACNKNDKPHHGGGGIEEGDELILIDGDFSDWAAAQGVVTCSRDAEFVGETVAEDHSRVDALKTMKVASDKYNIYFYLEVDMSVKYEGGAVMWNGNQSEDGYAAHLNLFFNTDNNRDTGATLYEFPGEGFEYYFEGAEIFSTDASKVGEMAGGSLLKYTGPDINDEGARADLWDEDPPLQSEVTGEGIFAGWGKKEGDIIKYELSFTRSFLNLPGKNIGVGAIIYQDANWMLMGALPQSNAVEGQWNGKYLDVTLL